MIRVRQGYVCSMNPGMIVVRDDEIHTSGRVRVMTDNNQDNGQQGNSENKKLWACRL